MTGEAGPAESDCGEQGEMIVRSYSPSRLPSSLVDFFFYFDGYCFLWLKYEALLQGITVLYQLVFLTRR